MFYFLIFKRRMYNMYVYTFMTPGIQRWDLESGRFRQSLIINFFLKVKSL